MISSKKHINLADYTYELPDEKIAKYPLQNRSESKLLVYKKGEISHHNFHHICGHLPAGAALFFNDTKVIPARLHFKKDTGALIEIFLLEPIAPTNNVAEAMLVKSKAIWKCMVGNFKKWKGDTILTLELRTGEVNTSLKASISNRELTAIEFSWNGNYAFVDIIEAIGKIPLPPYINREVEVGDTLRYQTVYSAHQGAVAAPTAGLHFTNEVLEELQSRNIPLDYLTLHVSAGTFQPIKEPNALDHPMHSEQVVVSLDNLNNLMASDFPVAVGTTSMRTMESLYWFGVKLLFGEEKTFKIEKLYPYQHNSTRLPQKNESLQAVKDYMESQSIQQINGFTEIFIFPGYVFKICKGLITNYHLPGSTLILLVAAFIGEDWRKVYSEALKKDYRFLSYGDSSLLLPS